MGKSKPSGSSKAGGGGGGSSTNNNTTGGAGGGCSQVKLRHILCEKLGKLNEAHEKLRAGERFETVAAAYSEDAARKGGDLGWKRKAELDPAFAAAAFSLGVGEMTSAPVRSAYGYHLILCEGRKA